MHHSYTIAQRPEVRSVNFDRKTNQIVWLNFIIFLNNNNSELLFQNIS